MNLVQHLTSCLCLSFLASGCSAMIDTHGNQLDTDIINSFAVGQTSKAEIEKALGSPSTTTIFDTQDWIYVHSNQERIAFLEPKETQRTVVVLQFDEHDILADMSIKDLSDGRKITPSISKTKTNEKTLGIVEQMISNAGKLNTQTPVY